jgi:hypothetical protein
MKMASPAALLLTGAVGTGKTAVAIEATRLLAQHGARAAAIDLDWLAWVDAPGFDAYDELIGRQLAAMWPNLASVGVERLVLARALLDPAALAPIRAALPGLGLTIVRLVASAEVIEERLRRRDAGAELAHHLAEYERMAALVAELPADAVVLNELPDVTTVAGEVLRVAGWT